MKLLMRRSALLIIGSLVAIAVAGPALGRWLDPTRHAGFARLAVGLPRALPDFRLIDEHGRAIARADLAGRPWIAEFLFLGCDSICQLVHQRVVELEQRVNDLRFVAFSIDPEDGPERLARYRRENLQGEARSLLVAGDARDLPRLAIALGLAGDVRDLPDALLVNGRFLFLVDRGALAVGAYDALSDDDMRRLADDAIALSRSDR